MSRRAGPWRRLRRRWKHRPGPGPWVLALPARLLLLILSGLPAGFVLALGDRCGRLAWLSGRRRRLGRVHLGQAMPDATAAERDRILRASCGQLGRGVVEAMVLARRPQAGLQARVSYASGARERFAEIASGPAVVAAAHLGSVEAVPAVLAMAGAKPVMPMRFPTNHYLGRELYAARSRWGVEIVDRHGAVRRMLRALRDGRPVVLAADQNAHHRPVFVPWFGRLAATERTPVALALRSGAPLWVAWALRHGRGPGWVLDCARIRGPAEPEAVTEEALRSWFGKVHTAQQEVILRHPEQYLWIHDRYRTRPPGEAGEQA